MDNFLICCVSGHQCVRFVQIMSWLYPTMDIYPSVNRLSLLSVTLYSILCPTCFLLFFFNQYFSTLTYHLPIRRLSSSNHSYFACSPPHLPVQSAAHMGIACTLHLPASATLPCKPRYMPASAIVSCAGVLPLLPPSAKTQLPVNP